MLGHHISFYEKQKCVEAICTQRVTLVRSGTSPPQIQVEEDKSQQMEECVPFVDEDDHNDVNNRLKQR